MMPSDEVITAYAAQFNQGTKRKCPPPLKKAERMAILQDLHDRCESGTKIEKLRKAPDAYLCMALVTAWSMDFCLRATGRVPGERTKITAWPTLED